MTKVGQLVENLVVVTVYLTVVDLVVLKAGMLAVALGNSSVEHLAETLVETLVDRKVEKMVDQSVEKMVATMEFWKAGMTVVMMDRHLVE